MNFAEAYYNKRPRKWNIIAQDPYSDFSYYQSFDRSISSSTKKNPNPVPSD
jgi:hypothetical protein